MGLHRHHARLRVALLASSALIASSAAVHGETWLANPGSSNFMSASNWSPASVPLGTAIFGNSSITTLTFSGSRNLDTFQFNAGAPAYTFDMTGGFGVRFNGAGIVNNSSNAPTFNVNSAPFRFDNASTAGNAIINLQGGIAEFLGNSTAGTAQLDASAGATFDFTGTTGPGGLSVITAGSINGAGNFALGTNRLVVGSNDQSTTVSGVISGNALTKVGTGMLTLAGINTYTGGTIVSGGTVAAASQNGGVIDALGSGNVTLDGAKLIANVTGMLQGAVTFADNKTSVLSAAPGQQVELINSVTVGPGAIAQFGTAIDVGTVVLSGGGTADATSHVVVAGGTLKDGNNAGITSLTFPAASTTVNAGAVLDFNDSFNQAIRNLKGAGSVVTGTVGGTLLSLLVDDATTSTFSGVISGPGAVMVESTTGVTPGTMILTGDNTYIGGTTICVCTTLQLGDGGTTGSIVGNVFNGGTLSFNRSNTLDFTGDISDDGADAGKVVQAGPGITILSGNNSYSGGTEITAGTLRVMNDNSVGTGTVTFNGGIFQAGANALTFANLFAINTVGATFDTNGNTLTISGNIIDGNGAGGALNKTGTGILALSGNNSYSGVTNILAGTLRADSNTALPMTTDVKVNSTAIFELSDGVSADINSLADGPNGGGTVRIGTVDTTTTLFIGANGGATTTFSGSILGSGSLSLDGGALTLTGLSSILGDLTICSCATLTLSGSGASFVAAGDFASLTQGTDVLGTLNVLDGAHFGTRNLFVGGTMTIDGAGTTAQVTEATFVGSGSTAANLTISGGAVVQSQGGALVENPLAAATVTVTGQGSTWTVGNSLRVGGVLAGAPGYLAVTAGATVTVAQQTMIGADLALNRGPSVVTVTGPGSVLQTADIFIGYACICADLAGTLTVENGARVGVTGSASIGANSILNIGTGGLGGTFDAPVIFNHGKIVANFTDTVTLAADITGGGTVQKLGVGKLIYTGTSTLPMTVDGGTLVVNGSISGADVNAGGTLGGNGSVGSAFINGGTLAPGNSIGTITIGGNLQFVGAGSYVVEVSPTAADRTNVGGTASLTGTLQAVGTGGVYTAGTRYTLMNATGGVSGTFGNFAVSGHFGVTRPHLEYDANNVYLVLDLGLVTPLLNGGSRNQRAVAAAADAAVLGGSHGAQLAALVGLTSAQLPAGLDQLSGEVHASTAGVLVDESLYARAAILGRLRQASYGGDSSMASLATGGPQVAFADSGALAYAKSPIVTKAPPIVPQAGPDLVFWSQGFGAWGRFNGDGNAANVRRDLAGFFTGLDSRAGANGRVGIAAGYTGSKNALDGRGSATVDTGHVAAYGGWSFGALNLRAGGAYAFHSIDTDRSIVVPGFFDRATAHYQGRTGQAFGELGYGFRFADVAIEPFAGAAWVSLKTDAAAERGGAAALTFAGTRFEVGYSTLGLRAARMIALADNMMLMPRVTAAWQHAYGNLVPQAVLAFQGVNVPFAITGVPIARDALLTEAGLDLAIGAHVTLGVSYTGQYAANVQDHAAKGKFSWKF